MRDFTYLDPSWFKAFSIAAETLNFTAAARKGAMTQSGVSQHIAKLESQLRAPLFIRANKRLILSGAGKRLKGYVQEYREGLERLREDVHTDLQTVRGRVSYAMPASCLMSPHFPLLLSKRRRHYPELNLKVTVCPSTDVVSLLLSSEIDFGFVTERSSQPGIDYRLFCEEEYVLVSRDKLLMTISASSLKDLKWIGYPGVNRLFGTWRKCVLPRASSPGWEELEHAGETNSLHAALLMVRGGLGATIVPRHCIPQEAGRTRLRVLEPSLPSRAALNKIFLVTTAGSTPSRRVAAVIDAFLEMVD